MQFRTVVPIKKSEIPIGYDSKILSFGSCFAENIGEKFDYFKFQHTANPFGIIFNPVSIESLFRRVLRQEPFTEKDIFFHNDLWHCFEVHSHLSSPHKQDFLNELNQMSQAVCEQLLSASHITVTLGTAWVYRNYQSEAIVANCHKVPQKEFAKELLSVESIKVSLQRLTALVLEVNKKVQFLFTVSPVRHVKDGFTENQLSKSHLFTALHQLLEAPGLNAAYFPSYEIMMDELRDYRFYATDMLHPNQLAIDYIWERFSQCWICEDAHLLMKEIDGVQKALSHRPFNPDTVAHQKFVSSLNNKIAEIQKDHPFITF